MATKEAKPSRFAEERASAYLREADSLIRLKLEQGGKTNLIMAIAGARRSLRLAEEAILSTLKD